MKKKIAILGSTGSIGKIILNILKKDSKNNEIFLLTANKNINEIFNQLKIFKVKNIIINDKKNYLLLKKKLKKHKINIYNNLDSIKVIFKKTKIDYTLNAISGLDGLRPTLDIIRFTNKIAIANKESIICGWSLINNELIKYKTNFIPIDSEHFSIWSLANNTNSKDIDKVFITASGGPFYNYPLSKFSKITIKQALNHPNWKMGKKITIDSATLMNKVFEVIEAKKIFNYEYDKLKILVHQNSYVHAIVKFKNGLTKILIHDTSMRIPIFNSFYSNFQKQITSNNLDFKILNNLDFKNVDPKKFPIINILKYLPKNDSLYETIIVSANDKLVELFLRKKISFTNISKILIKIIKMPQFLKYKKIKPKNIDQIIKLSNYVSLKVDDLVI
jgi:1-deoxy-D-xylulose-5-phosphate reductoisomerase